MKQAVVVGAGIAGLLAARVLSDFYETVTVVERDSLPSKPSQRKGIPQGRHLHGCLPRGSQVLGELFPGLLDDMVAAGAIVVDDGDLSRIYTRLGRYEMNRSAKFADPTAVVFYLASRPFLEFHVRRRVQALDNVTVLDGHDTGDLVVAGDAVTGVRVRLNDSETTLNANLVVDATGRASRTPAFLESAGYERPFEKRSDANWAYSSQLLSLPTECIAEKMMMINLGRDKPRGALLAYENDTWILTVGHNADAGRPPADFAEMLVLAEQITPPSIMAGLQRAQPIGDASSQRTTAGLWRRYDLLARFPTGLLVTGDALCSLNPIYGQGMTMAGLEALALRDALRFGEADLASRFFTSAAGSIGPAWAMNQANDRAGSPERRTVKRRLRIWTANAALNAARHDIALTEQLFRVNNLIDPPTRLRRPGLLPRIVVGNLRGRFRG